MSDVKVLRTVLVELPLWEGQAVVFGKSNVVDRRAWVSMDFVPPQDLSNPDESPFLVSGTNLPAAQVRGLGLVLIELADQAEEELKAP